MTENEYTLGDICIELKNLTKALEGQNQILANIYLTLQAKDIVQELKTEENTTVTEQIIPEKKGKYTWYPLKSGGKVRKCNNEPCPYFLKWNEQLKTYQHGKYDPETQEWYYVDDICEFYGGN